jgi:thioredoxin reductase (NADPH)
MFVFIGAAPHVDWLEEQLRLDSGGYILTGADLGGAEGDRALLETSRRGVFAAGDVRSGSIKRVASAVGEGAMAVRLVHEHLAHHRRVASDHGGAVEAPERLTVEPQPARAQVT